jgi:hypothetical protein
MTPKTIRFLSLKYSPKIVCRNRPRKIMTPVCLPWRTVYLTVCLMTQKISITPCMNLWTAFLLIRTNQLSKRLQTTMKSAVPLLIRTNQLSKSLTTCQILVITRNHCTIALHTPMLPLLIRTNKLSKILQMVTKSAVPLLIRMNQLSKRLQMATK